MMAPSALLLALAFTRVAFAGGGATLEVETDPPGARVFLGARDLGVTPLEVSDLAPGAYAVNIALTGYQPFTSQVVLAVGERRVIESSLKPNSGGLQIICDCDGALVTVGGENATVDNGMASLPGVAVGSSEVVVRREGYFNWLGSATVEQGLTGRLTVNLVPRPGSIEVTGEPEGATVYVNGGLAGSLPLDAMTTDAGDITVAIEKSGFVRQEFIVSVPPGKAAQVTAKLKEVERSVRLTVLPAGAEVVVDGAPVAEVGGARTLSAVTGGYHRLQISERSCIPVDFLLYVDPDQPFQDLRFELAPRPGKVLVMSNPLGAQVWLGNQELGVTPLTVELAVGEAELRVRLDGYEDELVIVDVERDVDNTVNVALRPGR